MDLPEFGEKYRKYIQQQWQRFQDGDDVTGKVRSVILDSWERCRYWQVPISVSVHEALTKEEFALLLEEEAEFIAVASPILARIFRHTSRSQSLLTLANARGVILNTWVGRCIPSIQRGAFVNERNIGTAGMPTCLATGEPQVIYAAEHYCTMHHHLVCVSSPVYDPAGRLMGGISLSSACENFHPYSMVIVNEAAKSIAEQIKLRAMVSTEQALIESFDEGLVVTNTAGGILRANRKAKAICRMENLPENAPLSRYFCLGALQENIARGHGFANAEVELCDPSASGNGERKEKRSKGRGEFCVMDFTPSENGGLLTFRLTADLHSYIARATGSLATFHFDDILGTSEALQCCLQLAREVADNDFTVLLYGESGTGKEMFAQSIHNASSRRNKPFVAINCGALPRELVQSELFGYAGGSFTGARKQGSPGKFEIADGGTIFLDEIGEMPMDAQVSLLRLLQNSEVTRIGASAAHKVNVRVIAATNRDLGEAVRQHMFREDLFYRLNVVTLRIPPLRERREDIPLLVINFLRSLGRKYPRFQQSVLAQETIQILCDSPWPGNVRQLEHAIERAAFASKGSVIQPGDLMDGTSLFASGARQTIAVQHKPDEQAGISGRSAVPNGAQTWHEQEGPAQSIREQEYQSIVKALTLANGDVAKAAKDLGTSKSTLYVRIARYNLRARDFRKLSLQNGREEHEQTVR